MHDRDRPRWLGIENSNQCLVIYRGGVDPVAGSGCGLGWLACYGIRRVNLEGLTQLTRRVTVEILHLLSFV